MQSYNPAILGCTFSRLLNGRRVRKQEKCWQTLLLLLQPSVLWLSIGTFNNYVKPPRAKVNFVRI